MKVGLVFLFFHVVLIKDFEKSLLTSNQVGAIPIYILSPAAAAPLPPPPPTPPSPPPPHLLFHFKRSASTFFKIVMVLMVMLRSPILYAQKMPTPNIWAGESHPQGS
jgi:hypothetical protein